MFNGRLNSSAPLKAAIAVTVFAVLVLGGWLTLVPAIVAGAAVVFIQLAAGLMLPPRAGAIRRGVSALEDDDSRIPTIRTNSTAEADLWMSIVRLARSHRRKVEGLERELDGANAVLEALPDPTLLLDARRQIVRVNAAVTELFGNRLVGRDLSAAIRYPGVLAAADAVLRGGSSRLVEFELTAPVERSLRAQVDRVAGETAVALVTLTDLTTLKRAEQLRADFVANASHELRTPLSTVIGFIETLEGPAADDPDARRRFLPIMRQQANRMARLVDDLLSLSRIELNEHLPPREEVDLPGVLKTVLQALDLKATARGMRLELELGDHDVIVPGNPEELAQLFQNVIDNALKYGNDGTPVTVTIAGSTKLRPGVTVSVRDRGDGIPRQHLPRLTERFYRVDTARSRAMGGTGLGLAIVKHIVSRHRGLLEIASELGEGSTFTIHLPVMSGSAVSESASVSAAVGVGA